MAINSRSKGCKNERVAAKVLEQWTGKTFAQVPSSGGLRWHTSNSTGDVICTTEGHYHPFSIEVKARNQINFEHLLYLDSPEILKFWDQALRDAQRVNKAPLLMMRYNGLPKEFFFIVVPLKIYTKFFKPHFDETDKVVLLRPHEFVILTTKSLLKVPYKTIHKPLRKHLKNG